MRVLFVSTYFPSDRATFTNGVHKRLCMFVDAFKEIAHLDMLFYVPTHQDVSPSTIAGYQEQLSAYWNTDISLFLCHRPRRDEPRTKWRVRWQSYGAAALSVFSHGVNTFTSGPEQLRAFEACLQLKPDMLFAHRLPAMCPPLLTAEPLPPIFFDLDDIEHVVLLRLIRSQPKVRTKLLSSLTLPAFWWGERRAIKRAARSFVCSEADRRYLEHVWRLPRVATVPNAVHIPEPQPVAPEPTLLFLGTYLYEANAVAAAFLLEQVFPRVHRAMPQARLILAGLAPEKIRGYHRRPAGVEFTGFVDDLDPLYRRARVVCAPLFSGVSGTQTKLIEAAAYGKPIVANRLGAYGVELRDGRDLMVRNDPQSFADACLELLREPQRCRELGMAARKSAAELYDRTHIIRMIQQYIKDEYTNAKNIELYSVIQT